MCVWAAIPAVIGVGTSIAGGVMQAGAQRDQAERQNDYYQHIADTTEKQAELLESVSERQLGYLKSTNDRQVKYVQDEAAFNTKILRKSLNKTIGSQRAGMAANNIDAGSATAEDIMLDTLKNEQLDELMIRYNADVKAYEMNYATEVKTWELKTKTAMQSWDLYNQAAQYRMAGENGIQAGNTNSFATLLGTAGSVANNTYDFMRSK